MPFQKSVELYPAGGIPGQAAGLNPRAMLLPVPVAGTGGVTVGTAVWPDATNPGVVVNAATGSGDPAVYPAPLGLVLRDMSGAIPCTDEATMTIPEGQAVPVLVRGDMLVTFAAAVTAGQKVFASVTDGTLSTGAAGATVAGSVETDWIVRDAGAAGEIVHISSW